MSAFYNEIDRYPAAWLRNLVDAGHIAPGVVDERSIVDLDPEELRGYTQAHFFAGIGVWSHALRLAGWADDVGVWTGSCPCQPFSAAGKRAGHADERHLWPAWFRLIRECRPAIVFGEQVAGAAGRDWLAAVRADMEGAGYAFGAADLCAAGAGAPHIRQRHFFVAYREGERRGRRQDDRDEGGRERTPSTNGATGELADDDGQGRHRLEASRVHGRRPRAGSEVATEGESDGPRGNDADGRGADGDVEHAAGDGRDERRPEPVGRRAGARCGDGVMDNASNAGLERHAGHERVGHEPGRLGADQAGSTPEAGASGFWSDASWVWCRDGVWRPHGPESFPLTVAHGASGRVGRLRAYGNAIVAPLAAEFVRAFMDTIKGGVR